MLVHPELLHLVRPEPPPPRSAAETVERRRWLAQVAAVAALPPPTQQPKLALAATARATLDPSELQDFRGSKRDALARTQIATG